MLATSSRPPPVDPGAHPRSTQVLAHSPAWPGAVSPGPWSGRTPRQPVPWGPWTNLEQLQSPAHNGLLSSHDRWQVAGGPARVASLTPEPPSRAVQESALAVLQDKGGVGALDGPGLLTPTATCSWPQMARLSSPAGEGFQAPRQQHVWEGPHLVQRSTPTPAHGPQEAPAPLPNSSWLWLAPGRSRRRPTREGQEDRTPSSIWQMSTGPRRGFGRGRQSLLQARADATRIMFTFLCQNSFLGCVRGKNTAV